MKDLKDNQSKMKTKSNTITLQEKKLQEEIQTLKETLSYHQVQELIRNQQLMNQWLFQEITKLKEGINQIGLILSEKNDGDEEEKNSDEEIEDEEEEEESEEEEEEEKPKQKLPKALEDYDKLKSKQLPKSFRAEDVEDEFEDEPKEYKPSKEKKRIVY